jgi:O-antigen/teichoic acid export membrane protein
VTSSLLGFAAALLLAHLLGSGSYGRYVFAITWANFLTVFALLGFDQFVIRALTQYRVREQWGYIAGLLRRSHLVVLASSAAIALAGCTVALLALSPSLTIPFCIAMLIVPINALTLLRQGAMQAFGRVVIAQLPEYLIASLLVVAGAAVFALWAPHSLTSSSAIAVYAASSLAALCVGFALLARYRPVLSRSARPAFATRNWLHSSVRIMLINGLWQTNAYVTIIILGSLASASFTGIYSVDQKAAALILLIYFAINMALAPQIARLHADSDTRALQRTVERMARLATLLSLPLAILLLLVPQVYLSLFGQGFGAGANALRALAAAQIVNALAGPAGNVLVMTGQERPAAAATAVAFGVNVLLAVALVPVLGITGSGIAFACSLTVWNVVLVLIARRRLRVNTTALPFLTIAH